MKFKSKSVEIEANQFLKRGECPLGMRTREDGQHYVVTAQGQEVVVQPGEWIILEDPPGDGTRAYPCAPDIFPKRWEPIDSGTATELRCANCGDISTNPGQFLRDGRWVCTVLCRNELADAQSYDDLAASGGIVDAS